MLILLIALSTDSIYLVLQLYQFPKELSAELENWKDLTAVLSAIVREPVDLLSSLHPVYRSQSGMVVERLQSYSQFYT